MKRRFILTITLLLIIARIVDAQTASFVNFPTSAKDAAMGNVNNYGSSILFSDNRLDLSATYLMWQPSSSNNSMIHAGGSFMVGKNIGILAGVRYNMLEKYYPTDENGNMGDAFSPSEYGINLGLAYKIGDSFGLSVQGKYIGSKLADANSGTAFAGDVDFQYMKNNLKVSAGVGNMGSKLDYGSGGYALPSRIKFGVGYDYSMDDKNRLSAAMNAAYQLPEEVSGIIIGVGGEYTYNNMLSIRAGYSYADAKRVHPGYLSVGAGVHFSGLYIDLSYFVASFPMKNTLLFTLGYRL